MEIETILQRNKNWVLVGCFALLIVIIAEIVTLVFVADALDNYLYWFDFINLSSALVGLTASSWNNDQRVAALYIVFTFAALLSTLVGLVWRSVLIIECFEINGFDCILTTGWSWLFLVFEIIYTFLNIALLFFYLEINSNIKLKLFEERKSE